MKIQLKILSIDFSGMLIGGCFLTSTSTRINKISTAKLANGHVVKVGYQTPKKDWHCHLQTQQAYNWAADKMKAMATWGGPYQYLQNQAIDYANKHHVKTNYILLYVPEQYSFGALNITAATRAMVTYYQCKYPPAKSNKIF